MRLSSDLSRAAVALTPPQRRPYSRRMRVVLASAVICVLAAGCGVYPRVSKRTMSEAQMFGAVDMRIHPIFSQVKDWTGDGRPDGVEALLEFTDGFGDPTKSSGQIVFELHEYRQYNPDARGTRVAEPWVASLASPADQRARWNRTSRTYAFQLAAENISDQRNYVLTAAFDRRPTASGQALSGPARDASVSSQPPRLFDQIILEAQPRERPVVEPAAQPAAAPAPAAG